MLDYITIGNSQIRRDSIIEVEEVNYEKGTYTQGINDIGMPIKLHPDEVTKVVRYWMHGQMPHRTLFNEDAENFMKQWNNQKVEKA